MEKFRNKYRIASTRLAGYDYGSNGLYFVTICTKNRVHYFGEIVYGDSPVVSGPPVTPVPPVPPVEAHNYAPLQGGQGNETNRTAHLNPTPIGNIAQQYWMDIPNHYPFVELDEFVIMPDHIHGVLFFNNPGYDVWKPNQFGPQSKNLGAVIRGFKSTTKRYANEHAIEFEWQSRFYDHIIRDEQSLNNIRQYIIDNPLKWADDELNTIVPQRQ